ncbi:hypothetical protein BGW38_007322, partial [Lunasporangiospora selenospora]
MRIDYLSRASAAVAAFFAAPSAQQPEVRSSLKELVPSKSVAIIGAGAAGASTAYYLHNFLQSPQTPYHVDHSITVYDQNNRIGGRCSVFRVQNPGQRDEFIEVGASIFVQANKHMTEAASEFGLESKPLDDELMAIWNGSEFVFEESTWKYWNLFKGLRRWGLSPIKLRKHLKQTADGLLEFYKSPEVFDSISAFAERFRLDKLAAVFSDKYMEILQINPLYVQEVVEVATRVNYGSNVDKIHALGAFVTLASNDALQIKDGNFQIFEGMIGHSKAKVKLNTKVTKVRKINGGLDAPPKFEVETATGEKEVYDTIVIATPIADIDFEDLGLHEVPKVPYRTIHTTFVRGKVNPAYFNVSPEKADKFPAHILTTYTEGVEFTSLSIQRRLSNGETVTKIFSPNKLEEDLLDRLYQSRTWVKRKVWKAYPKLRPVGGESGVLEQEQQQGQEQIVLGETSKENIKTSTAQEAWGHVEVAP